MIISTNSQKEEYDPLNSHKQDQSLPLLSELSKKVKKLELEISAINIKLQRKTQKKNEKKKTPVTIDYKTQQTSTSMKVEYIEKNLPSFMPFCQDENSQRFAWSKLPDDMKSYS